MTKRRGKRELIPPAVAARTGGKRVAPVPVRPFGALDAVLLFLVCALLLVIFTAALLPRLLGCTPYAITSDSMSPTLRRGDLTFVQPVAFDALAEGDILVFDSGTGAVAHRVYTIDAATRTVRTKADASVYLDSRPVTEGELVGKVIYKLPLLGHISLSLGGEETIS